MSQELRDGQPIVPFAQASDWEEWLSNNYAQTGGLWLKIAKKASGIPSITYPEAVEVALCYGWIDGQKLSYDESYFLQKFTPRRAKSMWSKVNVEKVTALIAAGKMRTPGQAAVDSAKADGRWAAAYDSPSAMMIAPDFQVALDAHPRAKAFYATLNKTNTYAFHFRLQSAKKPETRAARIEKFIAMLEAGEKIY